jgi:RHS repeat-associated protein
MSMSASSTAFDYQETSTTSVGDTYDGLNRDVGITALSGGYDGNGNLTYDGTRTFTYDAFNRLLTATGGGANLNLVYDPLGRLAQYMVNGGSTYIDFLYDGTKLIGEYLHCAGASCSMAPNERYIHGDGVDEPLVWFHGADTSNERFFIQDYHGSIIGYTDASGNLSDTYKYGPYGEPKNSGNWTSFSGARFRYTGQTVIPEASLYYYKARVYDPISGRFLQTDPIGSKDDLDLYAYTHDDPVNGTDPTGNQTFPQEFYSAPATLPSAQTYQQAGHAYGVWSSTVVAKNVEIPTCSIPATCAAEQAAGQLPRGDITRGDLVTVGTAGLDGVGFALKGMTLPADIASLTSRANTIHGALDPIAQSMRTTAVVQTADGATFVGSSQKLLSPAQRALLQPGEVAAQGAGHAEMTAVRAAEAAGQTPVAVGVSRTPCAACAAELAKKGIKY